MSVLYIKSLGTELKECQKENELLKKIIQIQINKKIRKGVVQMKIEEAEKIIDDMYQDRMNTRIEKIEKGTVIHAEKEVTFTKLEEASVILLREELSLKRKLEEKNKIIELMADFYAKGNTIRGTKEQIIEEFRKKAKGE